jgi:hypothetical protein
MLLWKYRLMMCTFVELERIIWHTSKIFVFGDPYSTVLATKPEAASGSQQIRVSPEIADGVAEMDPVPLSRTGSQASISGDRHEH